MNHADSISIGSIPLEIRAIAEQSNIEANVMNEYVKELLKEPPDPRISNHSSVDDNMLHNLRPPPIAPPAIIVVPSRWGLDEGLTAIDHQIDLPSHD